MTKIAVISDTHGMHLSVNVPSADIVVHCGDFSNHGSYMDALKFVNWFGALPHKYKIFIAGNHDIFFEQGNPSEINMFLKTMPTNVVYLQDSGIELEGIKFWGSPVQPRFFNWAFNRDRGPDIKKHWDLIPEGTDVLITHGPARFNVDKAFRGYGQNLEHTGCVDLLSKIRLIKPKVHLCGHIHYSYGHCESDDTLFINASICDERYSPLNKPYLIDITNGEVELITVV